MIKRVKTAKAVPPQRGLLPRLRNVRIRSKLGMILVIPIAALVGLAVVRLAEAGQSVMQAQDAMRYADLGRKAAELGEQLQTERSLAVLFLASSAEDRQQAESNYKQQFDLTDKAVKDYTATREELRSVRANMRTLLAGIDSELERLAELRDAVEDRQKIAMSGAIFQYRIVIANLLAYREAMAQIAGNSDVAELARGSAALGAYTEYVAQEHVVGNLLLTSESLTKMEQKAFLTTIAGQSESLRAFTNAVEPRHIAERSRLVAGKGVGKDAEITLDGWLRDKTSAELQAAAQDAKRYESDLGGAAPGTKVQLSGDAGPRRWFEAMSVRMALNRQVEEQLDAEFRAGLQADHDALVRQVIAELVTVLLVLFFAVLIALLIARSMARSLRRLREGALAVAYESLPQSVARLRNPETLGEMTPDQVAASVKDPVQVRGRDEIGQVSQAFNVVHREAVRIAAEQAALRANVATMFINLARRSQVLVDRLIGHLDRLERGEEDPDRLAELFQLDHLATRMRRNDENLLVLAGADSTRVQRDPAPLSDVLRAAQSEVEQYTRIEFGIVDRDVEVAPHAVNDVVHLLAELFDNATSFSPPDTVVVVDARRAGDRAILQIEDRGIGISAEQLAELNTRLANPPLVDVAVSRMMGLVVVGRLATRHGIRVELRAARERGTIADVILPAGALLLPQRPARQHTLGLPQSRSPLALEGAPGMPPQSGWQPPQQPHGGWSPSETQSWEPAPGWEPSADAPPPTSPPATTPPPARKRMPPPPGGVPSGIPTANGARDPHLPRRRPGEGLSPAQSTMNGFQSPTTPSAEQVPPNDVRGRRPAAEPAPKAQHEAPQASPAPDSRRSAQARPGERRQPGHGAATSSPFGGPGAPAASPQPPQHTGSRPGHAPQHSNGAVAGARAAGAASAAGSRAARASSPSTGSAGDRSLIPPNADDTMELPIFREVESAWFRTKQPSRSAAQAGTADRGEAGMPEGTASDDPATTGSRPAATPNGGAGQQPGHSDAGTWRTAADDGWQAASKAADPHGTGTTTAGLPKRVPMAQLVPGGVDTNLTEARNRSPDAVRGLLSAYHRGVQRGRQSSARTGSDEGPGKEQA